MAVFDRRVILFEELPRSQADRQRALPNCPAPEYDNPQ
eukprot:CAMPEP_0114503896 /NCGR_PEP_ID=MMETSP0109-20121206/9899_1 /TAXON_ID=29199 /ORGANISM="Chlorarachnion reptans, Strain CCCM449" /LENGTH=37 /DNA_ID= /DNA_START= /DNA_END= /DNA_ORIENTATION=